MAGAAGSDRYLSRFGDRWQARRGAARAKCDGFQREPEPFDIGEIDAGKKILEGQLRFSGESFQINGYIWDITPIYAENMADLHAFLWLDDLVAMGGAQARGFSQKSLASWLGRYGRGVGPGWAPRTVARRLMHWIGHQGFLLQNSPTEERNAFFNALAQHLHVLERRSKKVTGLSARIECYAALAFGSLLLKGQGRFADSALSEIAVACNAAIDDDGAIATRNPEELSAIFIVLARLQTEIKRSQRPLVEPISQALARMAPTLRSMRHVDGALVRAHGGSRGQLGALDGALAASEVRTQPVAGLHMGFARLNAPRLSLIIDAGLPPVGPEAIHAHASTLGIEATSGRQPLIVSCGSGQSYGPEWRRAARASASHSTMVLDGLSSSRFGAAPKTDAPHEEILTERPEKVPYQARRITGGVRFEAAHDGYVKTHGLTHARRVEIADTGRKFAGEDLLASVKDADKTTFAAYLSNHAQGALMEVIFHLHPDVFVEPGQKPHQFQLRLPNGEMWVFDHGEHGLCEIASSFFLERGHEHPQPTSRLCLTQRVTEENTRLRWWFTRIQDGSVYLQDAGGHKAGE